jgi:hypothetical protein
LPIIVKKFLAKGEEGDLWENAIAIYNCVIIYLTLFSFYSNENFALDMVKILRRLGHTVRIVFGNNAIAF